MGAAVGWVPTSSYESFPLEFVDQYDHPVGVQVQAVADGALALAVGGGQCAQEPEVPWLDAQGLEPGCQLAAYLVAES